MKLFFRVEDLMEALEDGWRRGLYNNIHEMGDSFSSVAGHYCYGREGGSNALIMMLSIARLAWSNLSCSL